MQKALLSTAYFPPLVYFSIINTCESVTIEKFENYHKQTYRNRCIILGANGPLALSVPVFRGSIHKTAISDIRIDDSTRWRKLHLRSIESAYGMAPFFIYYYDIIRKLIEYRCEFLLDFNDNIIKVINETLGIKTQLIFSSEFADIDSADNDYRYLISPKIKEPLKGYPELHYTQVFSDRFDFIPGLSIIDVLFNNGPGTPAMLQRSPA